MRAAQARLTARLEAQEADNRDRLHAIEADTAAAQDAAASALRHAAQWPATPANPTLRRETIRRAVLLVASGSSRGGGSPATIRRAGAAATPYPPARRT